VISSTLGKIVCSPPRVVGPLRTMAASQPERRHTTSATPGLVLLTSISLSFPWDPDTARVQKRADRNGVAVRLSCFNCPQLWLESCWSYVIRIRERDNRLAGRDRGRQTIEEWSPESLISQRTNMALSSWTVLWQCSMYMPPQSRNCMVKVTLPPRTQTIHVLAALLPRRHVAGFARCGPGSDLLKVDVDRVIPATATVWSVQISRVPDFGAAEIRPKLAFIIWPYRWIHPMDQAGCRLPVKNAASSVAARVGLRLCRR